MMKEFYDIVFVGNTSIDKKQCVNGKYVETLGGSAFNSYCATLAVDKQQNNKIYSNFLNNLKYINLNNRIYSPNYFYIDEKQNVCLSDIKSIVKLEKNFNCKHLHISIRKGIDFRSFLDSEIEYETLSIDVMIHSVEEYVDDIKEFASKIDFLFCNMQEYEFLKNIEIKGVFIITNEQNPVKIYYNKDKNDYYDVPKIKTIKSTTGAGDSFIGGFLSEYIKSKNIDMSVESGIKCSQICLKLYSNEQFKNKKITKKTVTFKLPQKIIIIGPSCAGKSFISKKLQEKWPLYKIYDDLEVLKERVEIDNSLSLGANLHYYKNLKFDTPKTQKMGNGTFKIIDESLWKEVIEIICKVCSKYSIIEFSRGTTSNSKEEQRKVYIEYLNYIKNIFKNDKIIVLFVDKNYKRRLKRNIKRKQTGGHEVDIETFKTYYKFSCKPASYKNVLKINSNLNIDKIIKKIGGKI